MISEKNTRTVFLISKEKLKELKIIAKKNNQSVSAFVSEAVLEKMNKCNN